MRTAKKVLVLTVLGVVLPLLLYVVSYGPSSLPSPQSKGQS